MAHTLRQILSSMELEEKILNGAALIGALSVFMPWLSGEWLGGPVEHYSGLNFFHMYLGLSVFFLNLLILTLSITPLIGVRLPWTRRQRSFIRLNAAIIISTLALAALSVLARLTFASTRMDIRFGIYVTIVCGFVTTFYAWLRLLDILRNEHQEHFMHPEDPGTIGNRRTGEHPFTPPPPPPPPPPLSPEEHRRYR